MIKLTTVNVTKLQDDLREWKHRALLAEKELQHLRDLIRPSHRTRRAGGPDDLVIKS